MVKERTQCHLIFRRPKLGFTEGYAAPFPWFADSTRRSSGRNSTWIDGLNGLIILNRLQGYLAC